MAKQKYSLQDLTQSYIDWVIKLGRVKFSILGFVVLALMALVVHILLSLIFISKIHISEILRSIVFGLISAPFVVYFFTQLVEKLEKSRAKLAETNREKSILIETISHELRTPLNGVVILSQILLDENLTSQQRNYLQTIHNSAVSLGMIFSDIMDLEKYDRSQIELCRESTELVKFLQDISNFSQLIATQHGLKFHLNYSADLPSWLCLDTARVSQVLWNLISNAVKFTPQGSVTLSLAQQDAETFAFTVEDTGIGIAEEELNNIFNMYYQIKGQSNGKVGSGIGLSISKRISQLMGGDLTVTSKPNQGSKFCFTFKAKSVVPLMKHKTNLPAKLRILLVEDIEINIIAIKMMLNNLGYEVDVAVTGQDGIEAFERKLYDLVLLDIKLPDISGCEVAWQLHRKYEQGVYDYLPPIVALTANILQQQNYYFEQGIDYVLRKPLTLEDLTTCLECVFGMTEESPTPSEFSEKIPNQETRGSNESFPQSSLGFHEDFLNERIAIMGVGQVNEIFQLFKVEISKYCQQLDLAFKTWQEHRYSDSLIQIAHKIKGACLTMGLNDLASYMQNIENMQKVEVNLNKFHSKLYIHQTNLQNWLNKKLK